MEQQYTIQIQDKEESTSLVTSKRLCLVGRSLISDIRIHLPSIKEMHLEIDMKNKRVTSYGSDVKVNNVDVGVNSTVCYEYGDIISLRNKNFVVYRNDEHGEERGIPLDVPPEGMVGDLRVEERQAAGARFNMSPNRPRRSSDAKESNAAGEDAVGPQKGVPKAESSGPSFFNLTDSSIENLMVKERNMIDGEIRSNIEFDAGVLNTKVHVENNKPPDLRDAVVEKNVLEDVARGGADMKSVESVVRGIAEKKDLVQSSDVSHQGHSKHSGEIASEDTEARKNEEPALGDKGSSDVLEITASTPEAALRDWRDRGADVKHGQREEHALIDETKTYPRQGTNQDPQDTENKETSKHNFKESSDEKEVMIRGAAPKVGSARGLIKARRASVAGKTSVGTEKTSVGATASKAKGTSPVAKKGGLLGVKSPAKRSRTASVVSLGKEERERAAKKILVKRQSSCNLSAAKPERKQKAKAKAPETATTKKRMAAKVVETTGTKGVKKVKRTAAASAALKAEKGAKATKGKTKKSSTRSGASKKKVAAPVKKKQTASRSTRKTSVKRAQK